MSSTVFLAMAGVICQACCSEIPPKSKMHIPPSICALCSITASSRITTVALNSSSTEYLLGSQFPVRTNNTKQPEVRYTDKLSSYHCTYKGIKHRTVMAKVKSCPCVCHESIRRTGGMALLILNLNARWTLVVVSRHDCFNPCGTVCGTL